MKSTFSQAQKTKDITILKKVNDQWESCEKSWLKKLLGLKPKYPKPPFNLGSKVRFINDLPLYGFQKDEVYTVYSMFLALSENEWFVRTLEMPSSTLASDFEWAE